MEIEIKQSEYYPFRFIEDGDNYGYEVGVVDLPIDKIEWINRVLKEFEEVQLYIEDLLNPSIPQPELPTPEEVAICVAELKESADRAAEIKRARNQ